ncbi:MAG: lytic transglycosylase domain-containing protein [Clostridia bacterium]
MKKNVWRKRIIGFLIILSLLAGCVVVSICLFFSYKLEPLPLMFQEEIEASAEEFNLSKALVAAVCFTESSFRVSVVSSSGAIGLMQLMPTTAVWIADKIGMNGFLVSSLTTPEINIYLGCAYLNYLQKRFSNENTVLCAYNAGEGTVSTWLLNSEYSCDGETLKKIPYTETERYVQKVNLAKATYSNQKLWS